MDKPIFIIGYPSEIGGANTELWHTVKLWRQNGAAVTLVPTWQADPRWRARLDAIGCHTVETRPEELETVPGLAGGLVVAFCNTRFLAVAPRLRAMRCRVIWLGCMNWLFPSERLLYERWGCFDRHVFQSHYQHDELMPQLHRWGFTEDQGRVIRGALGADEFTFAPHRHAAGAPFTVGRISRAEPDKFARNLWQVFAQTPHALHVRVLGWSRDIEARLGPPPSWAECLTAGAEGVAPFLATLHALVQLGETAVENWPRVGLEAMAAGVPLVVDARGGWREMIRDGETGLLCADGAQVAQAIARLAAEEDYRLNMVHAARKALLQELADPAAIWNAWRVLFAELGWK